MPAIYHILNTNYIVGIIFEGEFSLGFRVNANIFGEAYRICGGINYIVLQLVFYVISIKRALLAPGICEKIASWRGYFWFRIGIL